MRWTLFDPATLTTYVMPINPDRMSSPHPRKKIDTAYGGRGGAGLGRIRTFMAPADAVEWTFEGPIRTQAHHDALQTWSQKGEVYVTDHLGRTWVVIMQTFVPDERKPTAATPWRLRYTMKCLVMRQLAGRGAAAGVFELLGTPVGGSALGGSSSVAHTWTGSAAGY